MDTILYGEFSGFIQLFSLHPFIHNLISKETLT